MNLRNIVYAFAIACAVAASAFEVSAAPAAELAIKYGTLIAEKPATAEEIAAVKAAYLAEPKHAGSKFSIMLKETADDATLAAAVAAFPEAVEVNVDGKKGVKSLAAIAPLKATLKKLTARHFAALDLSPVAGFPLLEKADFMYSRIDDLSPLASCPKLKEISVYSAGVKDFTPLAACPKLECVVYYGVKAAPEVFATLGTLKNVKKFHGGLTSMTSLAWLAGVPQAEELKIFAEKIDDFSPIAGLEKLTYLRAWNMKGDNLSTTLGDLSFLKNAKALKVLELPGSEYTNLEALSGLTSLERIDLSDSDSPIDFAFAKNMSKLKSIDVIGRRGKNAKKREFKNILMLGDCPKLTNIAISKGALTAEELDALTKAIQPHARLVKITER